MQGSAKGHTHEKIKPKFMNFVFLIFPLELVGPLVENRLFTVDWFIFLVNIIWKINLSSRTLFFSIFPLRWPQVENESVLNVISQFLS